jgi:ADP-ribosyl-[dinitrogen reductase] hydrolase
VNADRGIAVELLERYHGAMIGLAVGDALGAPAEFRLPGTFAPITTMQGGGMFALPPGTWTDDTSMALCLADSLIATQRFDPVDQLQRYVRWYREGYLSSTGSCFDIGMNVQAALLRFEATGEPHCGAVDPQSAGNGCLMRLAPVPLVYAAEPALAVMLAAESARTTHGATEAVDACRFLASLIVGALQGVPKDVLLAPDFVPVPGLWDAQPLAPAIHDVRLGSYRRKSPPLIQGSGYAVRSIEAALWAFAKTSDFREGALAAINLGDDADTTGAIFGQLAGAYYGVRAIPQDWRLSLTQRDVIAGLADGLFAVASERRRASATQRSHEAGSA